MPAYPKAGMVHEVCGILTATPLTHQRGGALGCVPLIQDVPFILTSRIARTYNEPLPAHVPIQDEIQLLNTNYKLLSALTPNRTTLAL